MGVKKKKSAKIIFLLSLVWLERAFHNYVRKCSAKNIVENVSNVWKQTISFSDLILVPEPLDNEIHL
jgi:hypothetical protein